MCEMCDLREKVEKAHGELQFRFVQFQLELKMERRDKAQECEDRIAELTTQILADLRKRASWETQIDAGDSLSDILNKALN